MLHSALAQATEREEVCAYGREMEDRNLTIHTSGNVSRRVEEGVLTLIGC